MRAVSSKPKSMILSQLAKESAAVAMRLTGLLHWLQAAVRRQQWTERSRRSTAAELERQPVNGFCSNRFVRIATRRARRLSHVSEGRRWPWGAESVPSFAYAKHVGRPFMTAV